MEQVGQTLRDNGVFADALAEAGRVRHEEVEKLDYRAAAARSYPRYAQAFESLTTVVLEDGTTGSQREVLWRAYGKNPHLI